MSQIAVEPAAMFAAKVELRPRADADNGFIKWVTKRELVPTLERAWQFTWDDGHERKFMLDLLTIGETLIVTDGEQPVGYVWYIVQPPRRRLFSKPVFWINYLVVAREFQGRGVGARVMAQCENISRAAGCGMIQLWVQEDNAGARRFYERLGFRARPPQGRNIPMYRRL